MLGSTPESPSSISFDRICSGSFDCVLIEHVVQIPVLGLRQLVVDHHARQIAVLGAGLSADRAIDRARAPRQHGFGRGNDLDLGGKLGLYLDDLPGELENDGGLIAVVGGGINLAMHAGFGPHQMRQHNGGDQRRLAVLACHRQDGAPHRAPQADVRLVDIADKCLLERLQLERFTLAGAARNGQAFDERNHGLGAAPALRRSLNRR
jgi:hypothetical protein